MKPSTSQLLLLPLLLLFLISFPWLSSSSRPHPLGLPQEVGGRRALLSFKETPTGSNVTFECSPSGACVPCLYSEKKAEKFRCSETGYRIPLRCVEVTDSTKAKSKKSRSDLELTHDKAGIPQRILLEDSSTVEDGRQWYLTYRSCIPAVNVEKLSVIGFEGVVFFLLLASGTFMYFRRKRSLTTMPGVVGMSRIPTNPRF